jgi:hypothetical protein
MHGSERTAPAPPDPFDTPDERPDVGPEFYAGYDGECSEPDCVANREGAIYEGDLIRADGEGGYLHAGCYEERDA